MATAKAARRATPERWAKAAARAIAEGIEVRRVNASGMWVASSGTDARTAYVLEILNGVVVSCSCPAGTHGDPCCKHAARFYLDAGALDPEPPTPAAPACAACGGTGFVERESGLFPGRAYSAACRACREVYDPFARPAA